MTGLGPVFHSSELPYQLASLGLLLGHAVGYRVRFRRLNGLSLLCCGLPALLLGLRVAVLPDVESSSLAALGISLALLVGATAFLASRTLLWWSRVQNAGGPGLVKLYSCELLGAAFGLLLAVVAGPLGVLRLFPGLVVLACLPLARWSALCLPLALWQGFSMPSVLQSCSVAIHTRTVKEARVLSAVLSPYQLVEAVFYRDEPYLFLNGLCHHNPVNLSVLNYYLSALPAHMLQPEAARSGALVLGGGAMMSAVETCGAGLETTVVELDPEVLRVSLDLFAPRRGLQKQDPHLHAICGDARAYTRGCRPFGLIVFSLPYPYSLNVASLFTREYFTELRGKLAPGGILAVFLGAEVQKGPRLDPTAARFLHALLDVFPQAVAITSHEMENTVVLCRLGEPWDVRRVHAQCRRDGFYRFHLLDRAQLEALCVGAPPSTLWDFSGCAALNRSLWGL